MRLLERQEIEDIARGSAVLGTGGGGDPYLGKLAAIQAMERFGPLQLVDIDEIGGVACLQSLTRDRGLVLEDDDQRRRLCQQAGCKGPDQGDTMGISRDQELVNMPVAGVGSPPCCCHQLRQQGVIDGMWQVRARHAPPLDHIENDVGHRSVAHGRVSPSRRIISAATSAGTSCTNS